MLLFCCPISQFAPKPMIGKADIVLTMTVKPAGKRMIKPIITTLFLLFLSASQIANAAAPAPPPPAEGENPKLYLKLEPALVVNVDEGDIVRFLQVDSQIQYGNPLAQPIIEKHMPAIRHAMVMLLSGQSVTDIKTPQGKEKLRESTLKALQQVMTETTGEAVIDAVYFTGFVIQ